MGRWTRRDARRDFLREAPRQAEGRLLLRQRPGTLLGGLQCTPLERRQTRAGSRPAEEARRRAEARLEKLFRRERSPLAQPSARCAEPAGRDAQRTTVRDGSDLDSPDVTLIDQQRQHVSERRTRETSGTRRHRHSSAAGRKSVNNCTGSPQQRGGVQTNARSRARSSHSSRADHRCSSTVVGSGDNSTATHARQRRRSGSSPRPDSDWSVCKSGSARLKDILLSPDEGEGLTPVPPSCVRLEDFVDTILGEVTQQLERVTGGSETDEDAEHILNLYRQREPLTANAGCRLSRRLLGECDDMEDTTSQNPAESTQPRSGVSQSTAPPAEPEFKLSLVRAPAPGTQDSEEFVLQVCTSSQEELQEQDPLRYLQLTEAAGTAWLEDASPVGRAGHMCQDDLLLVRAGARPPCRPAAEPPPPSVGWLEAAAPSPPPVPAGWPDWRGGGDILDALDARRAGWQQLDVAEPGKVYVVSDQRASGRY